jgi:TonB family protein
MAVHPKSRPDANKAGPSRDEAESSGVERPFTLRSDNEIEQVAEILARAGGGALSLDLALDLVLNEMVERAREETEATGAVIALERDGEMICRATTGNAPELGVRVAASDLSAACLKKREVQLCSDTDADLRVDADACRGLGVRSMLIAPVADSKGGVGIVEVFSSRPNAFREGDMKRLQVVAQKISDSVEATAQKAKVPPITVEDSQALSERLRVLSEPLQTVAPENDELVAVEPKKRDFLTSVLVVLVIATSILLGLLMGVRWTMKSGKQAQGGADPLHGGQAGAAGAGKVSSPADSARPKPASPARAAAPPTGGLVVTENGKVIYRAGPSDSASDQVTGAEDSASRLLHRVDPQYPEAARTQRIQGPVVLDAQVLGDGTVGNIAIVQGDPLLAEAAAQAVKQWKYQPFTVDGHPVARQERITVRFRLPLS